MARKDRSSSPDGGWVAEMLSGIFGDSEVFCALIRLVGHGLFLVVRAVFHLLTCHF